MDALKLFLERLFSDTLSLSQALTSLLITLAVTVVWVMIGVVVSAIVKTLVFRHFKKKKGDKRGTTLGTLLFVTLKFVIWFVVLLAILSEFGFNITPILASAGILGLAIGFGAQNLVRDVISGFFIIMDNRYNIGETIEVNGFRGSVTAMNLRTTTIENFMGSVLILNNGNITQVINWSRKDNVALVDFGVDYDTDLNKVTSIMPEFLKHLNETIEEIIEEPSFLGVTELADSSINMRIMAKTANGKHWATERKIRHELVLYLNKHEITIPFPQLVVQGRIDT